MFHIPRFSLRWLLEDKHIAVFLLVLFNVLFVPIERGGISNVKVAVMGLCPFVFILNKPVVSRAVIWGIGYWLLIYFLSLLKGGMRFSTIGFKGMYIIMFITYYHYIYCKSAFSLDYFHRLLKYFILTYTIVLIGQQICILIGIRNMPLLNLQGQFFLSINKLPLLTLEPSHSARILTVLMLAYLRCVQIADGVKLTLRGLFNEEHRWVTIGFLWCMLTMGSGTAFIGLAIICVYFISPKTAIYVIPVFVAMFMVGQSMELEQMKRAELLSKAALTGDARVMHEADGSGAVRIIPVINLFTKTDLTKRETWIGKASMEKDYSWWQKTDGSVADQYGLIAFIVSIIFVYSCVIRRFFSVETLIFAGLLGLSLSNIYYFWGCFLVLTTVRYFQIQDERSLTVNN